MTEQEIEKSWAERGFSFGVGNIKVGDAVDRAIHEDQDELVIMASGKLEAIIDTDTFYPELGQEMFIPAKKKHSLKNIGDTESKIYFGYKKKMDV
jgi:mannose-6-phosphate isomerase-like protein (cupin superfamily)